MGGDGRRDGESEGVVVDLGGMLTPGASDADLQRESTRRAWACWVSREHRTSMPTPAELESASK